MHHITPRASGMDTVAETAPGRLPRPPKRPPAEPIIIPVPPRPIDDLEIENPSDADDEPDAEIKRPPVSIPELPPPIPTEERAAPVAPTHP